MKDRQFPTKTKLCHGTYSLCWSGTYLDFARFEGVTETEYQALQGGGGRGSEERSEG